MEDGKRETDITRTSAQSVTGSFKALPARAHKPIDQACGLGVWLDDEVMRRSIDMQRGL
jgi:hypothetical protein